jgi:hypothetical protein
MSILAAAIAAANTSSGGNNTCPPSQVAKDFYDLISDEVKPFFRAPRGVANEDGDYIGSIIQIAKGSLGRLHGPALELVSKTLLDTLLGMDERSEEEQAQNPLIIIVDGKEVKWDVRRYSSSQDARGKWQSIPDYSLYLDCTQREMREALSTEEPEEPEEKAEPARRANGRRGR